MKFYIVDAFTDKIFGGNPAGVVIVEGGEYPSFSIMQKTAAELNFSETAFIKKVDDSTFELRYITPTDEVDLCGHATIASFSVIANLYGNMEEKNQSELNYTAITKAGKISVSVKSGQVMMDMAKPEIIKEISDSPQIEKIRNILGLKPTYHTIVANEGSLNLAIVSTGLPDILFPVGSFEELNSIKPDFDAMTELSKEEDVVGVHAFSIEEKKDGIEINARNFAPLYGIPEEAATGTANGALTYYLISKGVLRSHVLNKITQGAAMDRPSQVITLAETSDDGNVKIRVGGTAAILSEGNIFI